MTMVRWTRVVAAAAALAFGAVGGPAFAAYSDLDPVADKDEFKIAQKCYRAILKESAKYQKALRKNIDKCKKDIVKKGNDAKFSSLAQCALIAQEGAVIADPEVAALAEKNDGKRQKMRDGIAKKCGGKDKLCGVGVDDEADVPLADVNWDGGACQAFETSGCESITVDHCGDVGDCLACQIDFAMEQVMDGVLADPFDDALFGAGDKPEKDVNKCQQTILKEGGKFVDAKRKELLKCNDKKVKRKGDGFDDGVACPDTDPKIGGSGLPKTVEKILKSEQKIAAKICKKCGGDNDSDKDGNCDLNPAAPLDFLDGALVCASVQLPPSGSGILDGEHRYGTDCGAIGTIDDLQEYIDCVNCVAEYKADCLAHAANGNATDAALGVAYPAECGTSAPASCGNGVVEGSEACDPAAAAPQCPNAGNGLQNCNLDCTCSCPSTVTFAGDAGDPASSLDTGWTGQAHDARIIDDGLVTVELSNCSDGVDGLRDPTCGVCDITGPVANPDAGAGQIDSQRCRNSKTTPCTADSDCGLDGPCVFFFGAPLPLSAGGVPSCIFNEFVGAIVGTADIETGDSANAVSLISQVHLGVAPPKPCHNCIGDVTVNDGVLGGTCDGGPNGGDPCDVMGVSPIPAFNGGVPGPGLVNGTSLDCPFVDGDNSGRLPINLSNSTGTESLAVSASGPTCTAAGFGGSTCMCDTCATAAAEPCNSDADCPGGGAGSCGGLRCLGGGDNGDSCTTPGIGECANDAPCGTQGEPTKPNGCTSGTCTDVGGGEGECTTGPFPGNCGPVETFKGCAAPSACTFPGDTCVFAALECFTDNGTVGGLIEAFGAADLPVNDTSTPTLGSVFCIAPTGASAINAAAGLPGAGRVTLTGEANGLP